MFKLGYPIVAIDRSIDEVIVCFRERDCNAFHSIACTAWWQVTANKNERRSWKFRTVEQNGLAISVNCLGRRFVSFLVPGGMTSVKIAERSWIFIMLSDTHGSAYGSSLGVLRRAERFVISAPVGTSHATLNLHNEIVTFSQRVQ